MLFRTVSFTLVAFSSIALAEWPHYGEFPRRGLLLQGTDVLAAAGEEISLAAQLNTILAPGRLEAAPRRKVYFSLDGERIGHALTSDTGIAVMKHTAGQANDYEVRLSTSRRDSPTIKDGHILLRVIKQSSFVMLVDVEKTLHDVSSTRFPYTPNEGIAPFAQSRETLKELSELRQIVYISSSNGSHIRKIKTWLAHHSMPRGPVLCWDLPGAADRSAEAKGDRIRRLLKLFPNVMGSIGNRLADAEACRSNSMSAYIISEKNMEMPELASSFKDWGALRQYIRARARTSHGDLP